MLQWEGFQNVRFMDGAAAAWPLEKLSGEDASAHIAAS